MRRVVMGDAAVRDAATPEQIAAMVALAHEPMASGALGFSSSLGEAHTDGDGNPVPSRAASHRRVRSRSRVRCATTRAPTLEFIPAMGEIADDRMELMADMSLAANRPLNWNLLGSLSPTEIYEQQLTSCDHAAEHGARRRRARAARPDAAAREPHARRPPRLARRDRARPDERRRAVADPATRATLRAGAEEAARRGLGAIAQPELLEIADAPAGSEALIGRTVADVAAERGTDPVDVLIDVVLPDRLPLTMVFPSLVPSLGRSDEGWRRAREVWRDDRTVLGGSDAGAHARPDVPRQLPDGACSASRCATGRCSRSKRRCTR